MLFDTRKIIQFAEFYPVGHRSTNYKKWFLASLPYSIKFKSGYEPYVLVSRKHMPWYDERFRGYGWDKVSRLTGLRSRSRPVFVPVARDCVKSYIHELYLRPGNAVHHAKLSTCRESHA